MTDQRPIGTGKPILLRDRISAGTTSRIASRRMYFVVRPRTFRRSGSVAVNSTSGWSRNGTRLSIDAAMLIWSCFMRSSCRYVTRSTWSSWLSSDFAAVARSSSWAAAYGSIAPNDSRYSGASSARMARRSKTAKLSKYRSSSVAGRLSAVRRKRDCQRESRGSWSTIALPRRRPIDPVSPSATRPSAMFHIV